MARDPSKLKVFVLADELVLEVYKATRCLPPEERFGLQSQIRRASVSTAVNIVEGCARPTEAEYLRFIAISLGSASEARYLLGLAARLELIPAADHQRLASRYDDLVRGLQRLMDALRDPA
ncbi:MAG: four helix bundle protein [Myxococcota bacterium]